MNHTRFELTNRDGDPIRGDVRSAGKAREGTAIVVCHGFKGFKDWGFFPHLCERLADETGHPVISFNFSGNGIGPDLESFSELDRFQRNTFSKELDDLKTILDASSAGDLPGLDAPQRFGLLGHSRGGISAIITSVEDERIGALVTWAAVAHVDRWDEERKREWREQGQVGVLNTRTGQMLPLGTELLEDVENNRERLDVLAAASRLDVPYLIVHGVDDESVSVAEARELYEAAPDGSARLETIESTGHTFGAVHPFQGSTEHLDRAVQLSCAWFQQHLPRG